MFSQKLKELRKQYGLTQAQLAKKLNVGQSTIGMYESNIRKPSYDILRKISIYFHVPLDELVNDTSVNSSIDDELFNLIKVLPNEQKEQLKWFINMMRLIPPPQ